MTLNIPLFALNERVNVGAEKNVPTDVFLTITVVFSCCVPCFLVILGVLHYSCVSLHILEIYLLSSSFNLHLCTFCFVVMSECSCLLLPVLSHPVICKCCSPVSCSALANHVLIVHR